MVQKRPKICDIDILMFQWCLAMFDMLPYGLLSQTSFFLLANIVQYYLNTFTVVFTETVFFFFTNFAIIHRLITTSTRLSAKTIARLIFYCITKKCRKSRVATKCLLAIAFIYDKPDICLLYAWYAWNSPQICCIKRLIIPLA